MSLTVRERKLIKAALTWAAEKVPRNISWMEDELIIEAAKYRRAKEEAKASRIAKDADNAARGRK